MIKVALMGHGVVGSGVAEILEEKASSLCQKAGDDLYCAKILDLRDFPDTVYADRFTKNFEDIVADDSIQIVVLRPVSAAGSLLSVQCICVLRPIGLMQSTAF